MAGTRPGFDTKMVKTIDFVQRHESMEAVAVACTTNDQQQSALAFSIEQSETLVTKLLEQNKLIRERRLGRGTVSADVLHTVIGMASGYVPQNNTTAVVIQSTGGETTIAFSRDDLMEAINVLRQALAKHSAAMRAVN